MQNQRQPADLQSRIRHCVNAHSRSILKLAFAYMRNMQDAEDITQEVFLSYFRTAPVFDSDEHEKAWLLRATINRCKNQLKSGWQQSRNPLPDTLADAPMREQSPLLNEVMALEDAYRVPIHLHYYEGYSLKEIGKIMGELPATIGTRLARGREQLRKAMEGGVNHA